MTLDRDLLDSLVADGWLRTQRHPDADLWIYNYTEKTQYENHWTPETLMCRGLILDADGAIVARPFSKFFNYGTPQAVIPAGEMFTVTEKIDGSLGILYYLPDGEARLATRGSFTSEQAVEGTRILGAYEFEHRNGDTPLFEIVYPSNRIVVDYGSRRELVLLAVIDNATGWESAMAWSGPVAERIYHDDIDSLQALARSNAEGFVVAFESGQRVKVKFAEYVRLHKIVTGVNARMIWDALRNGDDLEVLLTDVPDEIYSWIDGTASDLRMEFMAVELRSRMLFDERPDTDDRKTLAQYFTGTTGNTAVLFRMLDGKDYADLIWKAIKPGPLTPDRVFSEDAA